MLQMAQFSHLGLLIPYINCAVYFLLGYGLAGGGLHHRLCRLRRVLAWLALSGNRPANSGPASTYSGGEAMHFATYVSYKVDQSKLYICMYT